MIEQAVTYENACKLWEEAPLMAPCYVIIVGNNENDGMQITRNETVSIHPLQINNKTMNGQCLIQCNWDHWKYNIQFKQQIIDFKKQQLMCNLLTLIFLL